MTPRRLALALLLITPALWSVNYLVARVSPPYIGPHTLAFIRWMVAGSLFAFLGRHSLFEHRRHAIAQWRQYLVLGALGMWICGAWVYLGGQSTGALNIALIYAMAPVLIALVSAVWFKERLGALQSLGVVLALAGVLTVIFKGQWLQLGQVTWVAGDVWIVCATLSWTFYSLLLKRWPSPLSSTARLAVISAGGCVVLLPFVLLEAASSTWAALPPGTPWISVTGLGLALAAAAFPGFGAYLAYSIMQRELGAARAGVSLYLGPLYAAGLAYLFLNEPLHGFHAIGMMLVLSGIYLVSKKESIP